MGGNSVLATSSNSWLKRLSVTLCRRKEAAEQACEEVKNKQEIRMDWHLADLSDLESIKKAVEQYIQKEETLDVLITMLSLIVSQKFHPGGIRKAICDQCCFAPSCFLSVERFVGKSERGRIINICSQGLMFYPFMKLDLKI